MCVLGGVCVYVCVFALVYVLKCGFPDGSIVKNLPAKAGDMSLIPGMGRSPGEVSNNPLQYCCPWEILWTEEPGRLQSMGSQKSWTQLSV